MKKTILWILLDLIFVLIFNTIFFTVGGADHPVSVWLSYGFMHFSYFMVILTPFLLRKSTVSNVLGLSIYSVSSFYFIIEFIVGIVFILIRPDSIIAALITQVIIAGVYGIMLIINLLANESTATAVINQQNEINFIKESSSRIKTLIAHIDDKKINKALEELYDLIHSSPVKSMAEVIAIEKNITVALSEIEVHIKNSDNASVVLLIKEISGLVTERNWKIKAHN